MTEELIEIELKRYEAGIEWMHKGISGASKEQLIARPVEGKWSIAECICHIVDFETIFAERMKLILALKKAFFLSYDPEAFAANLAYQKRDLETEVNLYAFSRKQMLSILKTIPIEDYSKKGVHSERGLLQLIDVLKLASWHTEHHLFYVDEKREALNLPQIGIAKP